MESAQSLRSEGDGSEEAAGGDLAGKLLFDLTSGLEQT